MAKPHIRKPPVTTSTLPRSTASSTRSDVPTWDGPRGKLRELTSKDRHARPVDAQRALPGREPDYEVGYGKPPKQHRFQPGESGNSKGRRKKSRNADSLMLDELNTKVTIIENGRTITLTKQELFFKQLVNTAIKGDHRSMKMLLTWMRSREEPEKLAEELPLSPEDEALLNRMLGKIETPPNSHSGDVDVSKNENASSR